MFVSFATEQPTAQDSTTEGDSSYCVDFGKGKGPVAFTFDKDQYVAILKEEISNLEVLETRCIRNDNFDPNEPTLGAKFPLATGKSPKSAKKHHYYYNSV